MPPAYLHKNCATQEAADTLVTAAGLQDGRFLVRPRTGKKGQYVLCVVFRNKPTHHLIAKTPEGVYAINKKTYDGHKNVGALIKQLSTKTKGWPVPLDKPVPVGGGTSPAKKSKTKKSEASSSSSGAAAPWFAGTQSRADVEAAVTKGGAKDGNFVVRTRDGRENEYVLCVVYKGTPTHHLVVPGSDGVLAIGKTKYPGIKTIDALVKLLGKKQKRWPVPLDKPMWVPSTSQALPAAVITEAPEDKTPVVLLELAPEPEPEPDYIAAPPKAIVREKASGEKTFTLTKKDKGDIFGLIPGGAMAGKDHKNVRGVYVKWIKTGTIAEAQKVEFGWQIVALDSVDTAQATLEYMHVAMKNAGATLTVTLLQNDELFAFFEGKPPRIVLRDSAAKGLADLVTAQIPAAPAPPPKQRQPLLNGTSLAGVWSDGDFSDTVMATPEAASLSLLVRGDNQPRGDGSVIWHASVADDNAISRHDQLKITTELSYARLYETDDLYIGVSAGGTAVYVQLSTVRLFKQRDIVRRQSTKEEWEEGLAEEFKDLKVKDYKNKTIRLRRSSKIAVDKMALLAKATEDTLTFKQDVKWRLNLNHAASWTTTSFTGLTEIDGIAVDGVDPQKFVVCFTWEEGDDNGIVTIEDLSSAESLVYTCTGLARLEFGQDIRVWVGTNTANAEYKLTDFSVRTEHVKSSKSAATHLESKPTDADIGTAPVNLPSSMSPDALEFWAALEPSFMQVVQDPERAKEFWGISDFADDRAINLADVEHRVLSYFPVMRNQLALVQAYRRTNFIRVGEKSEGTGAWVSPKDLEHFMLNLFYYNKFYHICLPEVDESLVVDHWQFHIFCDRLGEHMNANAAFDAFSIIPRGDDPSGTRVPFEECGTWYAAKNVPNRTAPKAVAMAPAWEPVFALKGIWNPQKIAIEAGYSAGFLNVVKVRASETASDVPPVVNRLALDVIPVAEPCKHIETRAKEGGQQVKLTVWTALDPDAATNKGKLAVSFLVDGVWTLEEPFFSGAECGQVKSRVFDELPGDPCAVKLIKYDDTWGFWKIEANGVEIMTNPNGEAGSGIADSLYWLRPKASVSIYGEAETPRAAQEYGFYSVNLEVATSRAPEAGTDDLVYASFKCRCGVSKNTVWTPKLKFFTGVAPGGVKSRLFEMLPGPVVAIKLAKYGNDNWGFWRIVANKVEVLRDPRGEVGSKLEAHSPYWIHSLPKPRDDNGPWIETLSWQDNSLETVRLTERVYSVHVAVISVQTSTALQSATMSTVQAAFFVDGEWTAPEPFFTGSKQGEQHKKPFKLLGAPERFRLSAMENDGMGGGGADSWGIYTMAINGVEVLRDTNGVKGRTFGDSPYWLGGPGAAAISREYDIHFVDLVASTSMAPDAGTEAAVSAQFYVSGVWSKPAPFFVGCERGETVSKRFTNLGGSATRVRLVASAAGDRAPDTWGYWRLEANGHELLRSPNGNAGVFLGKSRYWLDAAGKAACSTTEHAFFQIELAVQTSIAEFADSASRIDASFLVSGMWTAPVHFFTGTDKGAIKEKCFKDLTGPPTRLRLSKHFDDAAATVIPMWVGGDEAQTIGGAEHHKEEAIYGVMDYFGFDEQDILSTVSSRDADTLADAWGYWRIIVNGREVLRDANGMVGSTIGESTFWLAKNSRSINEYRLDDDRVQHWWEAGLFGKHFNGQENPTAAVTLTTSADNGVLWWQKVPTSPGVFPRDGLTVRMHIKYRVLNRTANRFALTQPPGKTQTLSTLTNRAARAGVEVFEKFGHRSSEYERLEAQLMNTRRTDDLFIGISAGQDVLCVTRRPEAAAFRNNGGEQELLVTIEYPRGSKSGSLTVEDAVNPLRPESDQARWTIDGVGRLDFGDLRVFLSSDEVAGDDKSTYEVSTFSCEVDELENERIARWTSAGCLGDQAWLSECGLESSATHGVLWWHRLTNSDDGNWTVPPGHDITVTTKLELPHPSPRLDFCIGITAGGQAIALELTVDEIRLYHVAIWSAKKLAGMTMIATQPRPLDDGKITVTFKGGDGCMTATVESDTDDVLKGGIVKMQTSIRFDMREGIRVFLATGENPVAPVDIGMLRITSCSSEPSASEFAWPKFSSRGSFAVAGSANRPRVEDKRKTHAEIMSELGL